jgi:hypothetical protein
MKYLKYFNENKSEEYYEMLPHNSTEIFSNYKELSFEKKEYFKIVDLCKRFDFSPSLMMKDHLLVLWPNEDLGDKYIYKIESKKFSDEWFRVNTNDFHSDVKWFRCDGFDGLLKFLEDKMSEFRSRKYIYNI